MSLKPYVGITDFTDFKQVTAMGEVFRQNLAKGINRVLHVGVMMSYKTLNGRPSKYSLVFPPKESIAGIFRSEYSYNCLHYADYEDLSGSEDIVRALRFAGDKVTALQLDMIWPNPSILIHAFKIIRKKIEIILQVGPKALEGMGNVPGCFVRHLERYDGIIDRVLLDTSAGNGICLEAPKLMPYVEAVSQRFPRLGIVVAGGLGPHTIELVEPILKRFPATSIDAQSRLRPSNSILDPIDWEMAGEYIAKALELIKKYN